jgi:hypothetical protein
MLGSYLVLADNSALVVNEITWWSPRVLAEYTKESFQPMKHLVKTMHTKVYHTFFKQPWRQFVLGLAICSGIEHCLHFYDHSGGAISPLFNIHTYPSCLIYIICAIMFSSCGCIRFDVSMTIKSVLTQIHGLLIFLSRDSATQLAISPLSPELP